jgi:hypothetical protein
MGTLGDYTMGIDDEPLEQKNPLGEMLNKSGDKLRIVAGDIRREADGHGIPGAVVLLTRKYEEDQLRCVVTDDAGEFSFEEVIPGHYVISATANGYLPSQRTNIRIFAGKEKQRVFLALTAQSLNPEDLDLLAKALIPFINIGLPVMKSTILDKFGPAEHDRTLVAEARAERLERDLAEVRSVTGAGEDMDDARPCEVCGHGVMYGSRHTQCGVALKAAEDRATEAMSQAVRLLARLAEATGKRDQAQMDAGIWERRVAEAAEVAGVLETRTAQAEEDLALYRERNETYRQVRLAKQSEVLARDIEATYTEALEDAARVCDERALEHDRNGLIPVVGNEARAIARKLRAGARSPKGSGDARAEVSHE